MPSCTTEVTVILGGSEGPFEAPHWDVVADRIVVDWVVTDWVPADRVVADWVPAGRVVADWVPADWVVVDWVTADRVVADRVADSLGGWWLVLALREAEGEGTGAGAAACLGRYFALNIDELVLSCWALGKMLGILCTPGRWAVAEMVGTECGQWKRLSSRGVLVVNGYFEGFGVSPMMLLRLKEVEIAVGVAPSLTVEDFSSFSRWISSSDLTFTASNSMDFSVVARQQR